MSIKKKPPRHRRQCGSPAGYRQHIKRHEVPCGKCRDSWAQYYRARRAGEDLSQFRSPRRTVAMIRADQDREAMRWMAMDDEQLREHTRAVED